MALINYALHTLQGIPRGVWIPYLILSGLLIVAGLVFMRKSGDARGLWGSLLDVYIGFILIVTLICRESMSRVQYALIPLWSWKEVIFENNIRLFWQIVLNVILFIPFGYILSKIFDSKHKWLVLVGFGLSFGIEAAQLVFQLGLFEWDDMIHNTLGCWLGLGVYRFKYYLSNCVKCSKI